MNAKGQEAGAESHPNFIMNIEDFHRSLQAETPPAGLSPHLTALWQDGRGDWNGAHETVQDLEDANAAWIHAYLHRKEGDAGNAAYWYRRAQKPFPAHESFESEWREIAEQLF